MTNEQVLLGPYWQSSQHQLILIENAQQKGVRMVGIMMPQGVISRNDILYDWDSVKEHHKELIGRPVMYNHVIEGSDARSIGHYTNSHIMTIKEAKAKFHDIPKFVAQLNRLNDIQEVWIYEADLNPDRKDEISEIRRGDVRHVSIQLKADEELTRDMVRDDGKEFTIAFVEDVIEGSIVPTPGFLDTSAILVEHMKRRKEQMEEDVTTSTGGGAIAPARLPDEDDKKEISAIKKCEVCNGSSFTHLNSGFVQCSKCKTVSQPETMKEEIPRDLPGQQGDEPTQDLIQNFDLLTKDSVRILDEIVKKVGEEEVIKIIQEFKS